MKKILSVLLVLALMLAAVPVGAWAQASEPMEIRGPKLELPVWRTGIGGPTLAEGNHVRYLDRLRELPRYALDFYQWLRDNATAEGALADPSLETECDGEYYHCVTHLSGSKSFPITDFSQMYDTAAAVADVGLNELFGSFSANAGAVYNAFDRDCPEVFWLSGQSAYSYLGLWSYSWAGEICTVTYEADMVFWLQFSGFDIRAAGYRTPEAVAAAIEARDTAVDQIISHCPTGTAWEQVRYLNDTLTHINAYNRAGGEGRWFSADPDAWKCISALQGRTGNEGPVCEGYARAFKVLCDRLNIPCVLVSGLAKANPWDQPQDHMWNDVRLDGSWYAVDVTWNDPYVAQDPENPVSGCETEDYLGVGADSTVAQGLTFLQSRQIHNNVSINGLRFTNGPLLSSGAYVPARSLYSLSGTVKAMSKTADPVTVQLWDETTGQLLQEQTLTDGSYRFDCLTPGAYLLTLSKQSHAPQSCSILLTEDTLLPELTLLLIGDVSGDGKLNVGDVSRVYACVKKTLTLDAYSLRVSDVNNDGRINVGDVSKVYAHAKKSAFLW